jgi:acetyltransferase-like isoleucine patch superfamily enzyme
MVMGSKIAIWNHARVEGVAVYEGVRFNPEIIINDGVIIQQNLHLTCAKKIEIGKNTAIAANVSITDINHGYEQIDTPPERQPIQAAEVSIGENCKIYNNAVILPGTKLGRHNIVGANSVVKGAFPDYCVIAGAPAKILKRYNPESALWEKTDAKGNFIK